MAITVPVSKKLLMSATTLEAFVNDFQVWWAANAGNFSFISVQGAPITSFIAQHVGGWQIKYRISGGELLSHIAPNGGFVDSSIAETPTGASPEDVLLPVFAGTAAVAEISLVDDGILCAIKNTALDAAKYFFGHGKILGLTKIKANGPTGFMVLAYVPDSAGQFAVATIFSTHSTASNRKSYVQITDTDWASPTIRLSLESLTSPGDGDRFSQEMIAAGSAGDAPATADPSRGFLKYLFADTVASLPVFSVVPDGASDQGMMALNDNNANTRMRMIWNNTELT